MRKPSNNPITLPFGATTDPYTPQSPHNGTDFAYQPDEKIYAPFSGRVILVPNNGRDGNGIYMTDLQGRLHGMLHSQSYLVQNGVDVIESQPLGIMGETGYAFGRHLHWCVKENGRFIDPLSLLKGDTMDKITLEDAKMLAELSENRDPNDPANIADLQSHVGAFWRDELVSWYNSAERKKQIKFNQEYIKNLENAPKDQFEEIKEPVYRKKG